MIRPVEGDQGREVIYEGHSDLEIGVITSITATRSCWSDGCYLCAMPVVLPDVVSLQQRGSDLMSEPKSALFASVDAFFAAAQGECDDEGE